MPSSDNILFEYENRAVSDELAAKLEADGLEVDFNVVMSTFNGRRFMYRLIHEVCKKDDSCFTGNSLTNFQLGSREVGLYLDKYLSNTLFKQYITMLTEANTGRITEAERERIKL